MNILYIITQADGGGAQKYTLTLAKHFNGTIAAGNEANRLFVDAQKSGLKTFELKHLKRNINPWHDFWAVWEIRQLIKYLNPDIVHLNSTKTGIFGSFAAIGLKKKIIFTAHGFIFNETLSLAVKSFYLALEKTASSFRDFIITVSDADKKSALDNNLIAAEKISTIHNGISPINFFTRDEGRTELKLPTDKFIIGCIANAYKTKGLDVLIRAISMLDDEIKNRCQLAIIGNGPEIKNLKLESKNLQLENTIQLLGKIEKASRYLPSFDCLVLPSRKEGFPFVLLEALQAGLPIIATNVGGNPEALGDAGILVEPENPQALAYGLTAIIKDGDKRKNLSQKTQERAKLFSEEKMLAETEKIYWKILD